jgi:Nitrate and nitrite sensing/HAMP domain
MGLRRRSVRLRIVLLVLIPVLSVIGLYAFVVSVTAGNAISVGKLVTLKNSTAVPVFELQGQTEAERLLAVLYLASPTSAHLGALSAQQAKTNQARSVFTAAVTSSSSRSVTSMQDAQAVTAMRRVLAGLPALRGQIAARTISRQRAIIGYNRIVTAADLVVHDVVTQQINAPLLTQELALVRVLNAGELLLEEDTLLTGDVAARSFPAADLQDFTQLTGARRTITAQAILQLDPQIQALYRKDVSPRASAALAALENGVIYHTRPGNLPRIDPASWQTAVGAVDAGQSRAVQQAANVLTTRAQATARSTYLQLFLAGGLGLLAVLVSVIASIWIGRGLVRQLAQLRQTALQLANERLPSVIARLDAGENVDVSAEAPPIESSLDEIGQVSQAFNAVQRTAIEAAVDEAKLRRAVSDVFRNLARRSQSLLHRQLALLDAMERRASEPEELEDLFRIDHLTTRMRRHSEGLIILSGESPGRGWRHPVRIVDVLRAAVAEVEDYTRIRVVTGSQAALIGPAVADVIHLIAELAENATTFSPPHTPVRIHGDIVGRGFAVEVEDRGLGMGEEKLAKINHDLAHPPQFDLSGSEQLGLFVAGQLARRHDIRITLQSSPYGGITAVALIPKALIVDDAEALAASDRAIRLTGRHHAALNHGLIAEPETLAQLSGPTSATDVQNGPAAELPPGPGEDTPAGPIAQRDSVFTPRPPRVTTDSRVAPTELTEMGLPVRVRQASLAPQLRDRGPAAAEPAQKAADAPSPEAARSTMTALQRGWERGRYSSGAAVPSFGMAQSPEPGGKGDEQPKDE